MKVEIIYQPYQPFVEDYVVLGKQSNSQIVSSFESLKGEKIAMLDNNSLYDYFKK